jgi:hypothetical protein
MVTDHLGDHKAQKALTERRVEIGRCGQVSQSSDLLSLTVGVGGRKARDSLVLPDGLRNFEPLGQQKNQRSINIVNAGSVLLELRIGHQRRPPVGETTTVDRTGVPSTDRVGGPYKSRTCDLLRVEQAL